MRGGAASASSIYKPQATARHRGTTLVPLLEAVQALGTLRQAAWVTYRERARMDAVPEDFRLVLEDLARFVDPLVAKVAAGTWRPHTRVWES